MGEVVELRKKQGYQHLIKFTQLHLRLSTTRCGKQVQVRPAREVRGLPICPDCTNASSKEKSSG